MSTIRAGSWLSCRRRQRHNLLNYRTGAAHGTSPRPPDPAQPVTKRARSRGMLGMVVASPVVAFGREIQQDDKTRTGSVNSALALARLLNRTRFGDLPPVSVERAKMIIASTFASAASGSTIASARIVRDRANPLFCQKSIGSFFHTIASPLLAGPARTRKAA